VVKVEFAYGWWYHYRRHSHQIGKFIIKVFIDTKLVNICQRRRKTLPKVCGIKLQLRDEK
jgi:hypothetical protein